MKTRMSGTSGRWSMWLAVAFLMAMTSTLSAQMAATGGMASPGASVDTAGSFSVGSFASDRASSQLPYGAGTCGTDTTKPGHLRLQLFARQFHLAMRLFPSHLALQILAYRMWIQSTVDVLPPG